MSNNKDKDVSEVIHVFFSENSPEHYRKYISAMLKAAYSEGYWKKSDPGSLIHFQNRMEELIKAVHVFVKKGKTRVKINEDAIQKEAILEGDITLSSVSGKNGEEDIWEFFPRSLSRKEFLNPYIVYKKFFQWRGLSKWLEDFSELISYALSPFGNESALDFDYMEIHEQLQKLVDASLLIEVRTHKPE